MHEDVRIFPRDQEENERKGDESVERQSTNNCENVEPQLDEDCAQVMYLDKFRCNKKDNADG